MNNKKIFSYIFHYLSFYKFRAIISMIAIFLVSASILSLGILIRILIDKGLNGHDVNALNNIILYISSLVLILGFSSFIRSFFVNTIGENVINHIRLDVYSHLLKMKIPEFEKITPTDIVARLSTDLDLISRIIIDIFSFCVRNGVMFLGGLCLMFYHSVKLSSIALMIVPGVILFLMKFGKKVRALSRDVQSKQALLSSSISESFSGINTIYAFNAQSMKEEEFKDQSFDLLSLSGRRLFFRSSFFALAITSIMFSIVFVIWVGSKDVASGNISSGSLASFIFYASSSAFSIAGIAEVISELWRCMAAAERVFVLLENNEIEGRSISNLADENVIKNSIEFRNVSFNYPSRLGVSVIHDLSFKTPSSGFVGIVGASGCGKSTIFQLLLKFHSNLAGDILVGGKNINDFSEVDLRSKIAYVNQDPFIFSGSINENLSLGGISDKRDEILKHCGVDEIIKNLPDGDSSSIGIRGASLSGGQRQKIAIARALLYNPDILLLDEATSALDQKTEQDILAYVRKFMKGKLVISIAHRILSLEEADDILVMDAGKIIEQDSHENLLKNCPLYQKLSLVEL